MAHSKCSLHCWSPQHLTLEEYSTKHLSPLPPFLGHSFKDQTIPATKIFLRLPLTHLLEVSLAPTLFVPEKN